MVRDNRHDSAYLFGAVCHARLVRSDERASQGDQRPGNARRACRRGVRRRRLHQQGERLHIPDNVTLLPLPPYNYSPELNPMENIWDYLRGNKLSRRFWQSYEAIVAACKEAWLFLTGDPERIDSIAHRAWACVNL